MTNPTDAPPRAPADEPDVPGRSPLPEDLLVGWKQIAARAGYSRATAATYLLGADPPIPVHFRGKIILAWGSDLDAWKQARRTRKPGPTMAGVELDGIVDTIPAHAARLGLTEGAIYQRLHHNRNQAGRSRLKRGT